MTEKLIITETRWHTEKLWGAPAIAKFAGVDVSTIRRWHRTPGCPITKPGGRYFVMRSELFAWMTAKDAA